MIRTFSLQARPQSQDRSSYTAYGDQRESLRSKPPKRSHERSKKAHLHKDQNAQCSYGLQQAMEDSIIGLTVSQQSAFKMSKSNTQSKTRDSQRKLESTNPSDLPIHSNFVLSSQMLIEDGHINEMDTSNPTPFFKRKTGIQSLIHNSPRQLNQTANLRKNGKQQMTKTTMRSFNRHASMEEREKYSIDNLAQFNAAKQKNICGSLVSETHKNRFNKNKSKEDRQQQVASAAQSSKQRDESNHDNSDHLRRAKLDSSQQSSTAEKPPLRRDGDSFSHLSPTLNVVLPPSVQTGFTCNSNQLPLVPPQVKDKNMRIQNHKKRKVKSSSQFRSKRSIPTSEGDKRISLGFTKDNKSFAVGQYATTRGIVSLYNKGFVPRHSGKVDMRSKFASSNRSLYQVSQDERLSQRKLQSGGVCATIRSQDEAEDRACSFEYGDFDHQPKDLDQMGGNATLELMAFGEDQAMYDSLPANKNSGEIVLVHESTVPNLADLSHVLKAKDREEEASAGTEQQVNEVTTSHIVFQSIHGGGGLGCIIDYGTMNPNEKQRERISIDLQQQQQQQRQQLIETIARSSENGGRPLNYSKASRVDSVVPPRETNGSGTNHTIVDHESRETEGDENFMCPLMQGGVSRQYQDVLVKDYKTTPLFTEQTPHITPQEGKIIQYCVTQDEKSIGPQKSKNSGSLDEYVEKIIVEQSLDKLEKLNPTELACPAVQSELRSTLKINSKSSSIIEQKLDSSQLQQQQMLVLQSDQSAIDSSIQQQPSSKEKQMSSFQQHPSQPPFKLVKSPVLKDYVKKEVKKGKSGLNFFSDERPEGQCVRRGLTQKKIQSSASFTSQNQTDMSNIIIGSSLVSRPLIGSKTAKKLEDQNKNMRNSNATSNLSADYLQSQQKLRKLAEEPEIDDKKVIIMVKTDSVTSTDPPRLRSKEPANNSKIADHQPNQNQQKKAPQKQDQQVLERDQTLELEKTSLPRRSHIETSSSEIIQDTEVFNKQSQPTMTGFSQKTREIDAQGKVRHVFMINQPSHRDLNSCEIKQSKDNRRKREANKNRPFKKRPSSSRLIKRSRPNFTQSGCEEIATIQGGSTPRGAQVRLQTPPRRLSQSQVPVIFETGRNKILLIKTNSKSATNPSLGANFTSTPSQSSQRKSETNEMGNTKKEITSKLAGVETDQQQHYNDENYAIKMSSLTNQGSIKAYDSILHQAELTKNARTSAGQSVTQEISLAKQSDNYMNDLTDVIRSNLISQQDTSYIALRQGMTTSEVNNLEDKIDITSGGQPTNVPYQAIYSHIEMAKTSTPFQASSIVVTEEQDNQSSPTPHATQLRNEDKVLIFTSGDANDRETGGQIMIVKTIDPSKIYEKMSSPMTKFPGYPQVPNADLPMHYQGQTASQKQLEVNNHGRDHLQQVLSSNDARQSVFSHDQIMAMRYSPEHDRNNSVYNLSHKKSTSLEYQKTQEINNKIIQTNEETQIAWTPFASESRDEYRLQLDQTDAQTQQPFNPSLSSKLLFFQKQAQTGQDPSMHNKLVKQDFAIHRRDRCIVPNSQATVPEKIHFKKRHLSNEKQKEPDLTVVGQQTYTVTYSQLKNHVQQVRSNQEKFSSQQPLDLKDQTSQGLQMLQGTETPQGIFPSYTPNTEDQAMLTKEDILKSEEKRWAGTTECPIG